ncbi:glucokinase [Arthrobacter alpinus]|uniref:ROK family glucokinase n=1 Tax=Arthrobacter alpinus TaxID=656366 RepID=UPI0005C86D17|nr:ROK family glucokinase [Arthrobacter alpinus]ALV45500.1 glucokinase [Arthrobacter alpinus]
MPAAPSRPLALGIDIGGTKVAAGVVDGAGVIIEELRRVTPGRDARAVESVIVELVTELGTRHKIESVGIGAAGWMDLEGARVVFSPHLAWRDEPLRDTLESMLGRPVLVTNDADAAAWAESHFGAGRGHSRMIMLTLGTGIGGALVLDGKVERGAFGMAGEFGHQIIMPGGHRCECGNRGCWEQYASGNALGREGRELARKQSPMAAGLLEATHGKTKDITGTVVTELALQGEATAQELVAEVGDWLGLGMANLAAALDPAIFVIGGGLSAAGDLLLEPARRAYARNLTGRGYRKEAAITVAELGAAAGLIGAADLSRTRS